MVASFSCESPTFCSQPSSASIDTLGSLRVTDLGGSQFCSVVEAAGPAFPVL